MVEANSAIAIIPGDCFRWRARVQFVDSFPTQSAALNYAIEHGHNLIVERNEGSSQLFDVLEDPDGACTTDLKLELLANEEVLVEPENTSWTLLFLLTLWNLAKRFVATMARAYTRVVTSRLGQAANQQRWKDLQRSLRLAWYRHAHWGIRNLNRQFGEAISFYRSEIVPHYRHAVGRYWWSGRAVDFRRWLYRHSQGDIRDLAKRLAAVTATTYSREIAPRLRHAIISVRKADYKDVILRAWSISITTVSIRARQFATVTTRLYRHKVIPALRHAAISVQQVIYKDALRRAWGISITTVSIRARQFATVTTRLHRHKVIPALRHAGISVRQADLQGAIRRAWSITLLTAIRLVDRFVATVASFYVREVTPRLRRAAEKYQQAEIEEGLRRSIGAVAAPRHSNSSQLV